LEDQGLQFPAAARQLAPDERIDAARRGPLILVIDDEAGIRALIRHALAKGGLACDLADCGQHALELAAATQYDLLLCDLELPDLRGDKVLRRIRTSAQVPHQKVIVISGGCAPDELAGTLSAGADDFLEKPLSAGPLLARVQAALRLKEAQDRSDRLNRSLQEAYAELEVRVRERTQDLLTANGALHEEIGERRRAEEEARQAHVENEQLLAAVAAILVGVDGEGRVTRWNERAEAALGIAAAEAKGRPLSEVGVRWEDAVTLRRLVECRNAKEPTRLDHVPFTRPDGRRGILAITITTVHGGSGSPPGLLLLGQEVTERRHLEAQLAQAQKLESIGQLAAGIAHEINTPIQYVSDNTTFLQGAFDDLRETLRVYQELHEAAGRGAPPRDLIERVGQAVARADLGYLTEEIPRAISQTLEGVGRVAKIVRAMKEFSHPGGEDKIAVDLNRAIENTITVARHEWKYVAEVEADLDPGLPPVPCLPGEFNQVILNLLVNAAHTIADRRGSGEAPKGRITIKTRQNAGQVEIRVGDTGCGIPEAIRARVFDPFFTTKPVGKGTGQGLAIAHAVVVKRHGGTIRFETEVGRGTTFIIGLPLGGDLGREVSASHETTRPLR